MSKESMSSMMSKLKSNSSRSETAKEYARSAEWPKCFHAGCPLQATIKADNATCTYHYREHGFHAECITEATKEYEGYLKKCTQMIYWDVKAWKERRHQMMGWDVLPATEEEMNWPNKYLNRFRSWIDNSIREKADSLYHNKHT